MRAQFVRSFHRWFPRVPPPVRVCPAPDRGRHPRDAGVRRSARADHVRPVPNNDPAAVVEAYAAAVNAGDLAAILALYADDAVHIALPTADGSAGVCLGKAQFRLWYQQSLANGERLEVVEDSLTVAGDRVTFLARLTSDPWRKLGLGSLEANVEAVVVDGRFTTHVVMLTPGSVRELLTALGTIPTPPAGTEPVSEPHHGPR